MRKKLEVLKSNQEGTRKDKWQTNRVFKRGFRNGGKHTIAYKSRCNQLYQYIKTVGMPRQLKRVGIVSSQKMMIRLRCRNEQILVGRQGRKLQDIQWRNRNIRTPKKEMLEPASCGRNNRRSDGLRGIDMEEIIKKRKKSRE